MKVFASKCTGIANHFLHVDPSPSLKQIANQKQPVLVIRGRGHFCNTVTLSAIPPDQLKTIKPFLQAILRNIVTGLGLLTFHQLCPYVYHLRNSIYERRPMASLNFSIIMSMCADFVLPNNDYLCALQRFFKNIPSHKISYKW